MRVVSVPVRLRLAVVLIVLCVPLAALEAVLYYRAPWWNLPYGPMTAASLAALAVFAPLAFLMTRGWKTAWKAAVFSAAVWVSATTWISISHRNFWLGISAILLASFWIALLSWIRTEMSRSFFDPLLAWFEGRPRPIPGLSCEYQTPEGAISLRVSRLDHDGLFAFRSKGLALPVRGRKVSVSSLDLKLRFRDQEITCVAKPVTLLPDGAGVGLRFCENAPDRIKELGDFVELLRGEGYVG